MISSLEEKNKILLAGRIELESRMADIIYESDEILAKYEQIKHINHILQEKIQSFENEVSIAQDDDQADMIELQPVQEE